jgi:peptidoglycan/LPS O-acetylase OafA/YrhL
MKYRSEIDGLRALAVVPVVLFHAGVHALSGGFVGVDIFFVISGYLITSIILTELEQGKFSVLNFYERRARRILPALYGVMAVSSVLGYLWMMPDEFKNYGQSLLATTLFSNNILLSVTSGYWDLNSEFKPLLHTWSLGVEEQYYILFPIFLMVGWKYFRKSIVASCLLIALASLLLANWGVDTRPEIAFYVLPTRAWEILLGALVAFYLKDRPDAATDESTTKNQLLSGCGLIMIVGAIVLFDKNYPAPGFYMLVPTLGAALIIVYARAGTLAHRLLADKLVVGLGLISYSFYLWHQPLLAFSRIYLKSQPTLALSLGLVLMALVLSYLTWRFVEQPFRNRKAVSRRTIFASSGLISCCFVGLGLYLNQSYGMASRVFDASVKLEEMDKRIYNSKVFSFKKDQFDHPEKLKILVIGNSYARDFINMTSETFDTSRTDIVYRDDLTDCIVPFIDPLAEKLFSKADVIVFGGGFRKECVHGDIAFATGLGKKVFYFGNKHFGYNENWLIRLKAEQRADQYNVLLPETFEDEQHLSSAVPPEYYISFLAPVVRNGEIPITDHMGRLLSADRMHLTRYGAIFFGDKVLGNGPYGQLFPGHK